MAGSDKDRVQRRVYMLPVELVERITAFQTTMGLSSEVEAARRLLDEALKYRDGPEEIIKRFAKHAQETRILSDIARIVLVGHPKVANIKFDTNRLEVDLVDGEEITFYPSGLGSLKTAQGTRIRFDRQGVLEEDIIPF